MFSAVTMLVLAITLPIAIILIPLLLIVWVVCKIIASILSFIFLPHRHGKKKKKKKQRWV